MKHYLNIIEEVSATQSRQNCLPVLCSALFLLCHINGQNYLCYIKFVSANSRIKASSLYNLESSRGFSQDFFM